MLQYNAKEHPEGLRGARPAVCPVGQRVSLFVRFPALCVLFAVGLVRVVVLSGKPFLVLMDTFAQAAHELGNLGSAE